MANKLEDYLNRHRNELDVESPDDASIWDGIRSSLGSEAPPDRTPRSWWPRVRNFAATAVILLALGYMIGDLVGERRQAGLSGLDPELGVREGEYQHMLQVKLLEAGQFDPEVHNQVVRELFDEIQKLDTIYEHCLKDLESLGYNEQVINTIFDTYEKKIYLLELIILETHKKPYHETNPDYSL